MGTVKNFLRLIYVLVYNFWIKAVTMATSNLMIGRYIPHFDRNIKDGAYFG